ncbi:MAG TPA: 3-deoxy-manno-octulosonate cytidylyltransferase [Phycisphaerales bacterium]|nr:3-deoxy-manno-octulosonate cytidylyltransferase [Phycisphaerales bacterium]
MNAVAIIPARLGSTRLPGKVLLDATGKPLIRHVWESAKRAACLSRVIIATDDARVLAAARGFGAEAVLTGEHPNGTSRLCEAGALLGLAADQIIVNVQGDEPEVEPEAIDAAVAVLETGECSIGTIAVPFAPGENPADPNCVKVVRGLSGNALYFSRSVIPFDRDGGGGRDAACLRHVGLYAYRQEFLERYARLEPTPLERAEQLEQLRALQHGFRIGVAVRPSARIGIDTAEQYAAFVARISRAS